MTINNSHQNSNPNPTIQIPNYQILETVYSGSRTLVYRAIGTNDRLPVVIKLLKREYPTFSELLQFRNQYTIAKNLDIPGIIKPYSLQPYQNGYALVMEDFGGISLREFSQGEPFNLEQFLPIALQIIDTLHKLHQQRVIHKDIKPANILIHPENREIKLIDFSIASLLPRETQEIQSINGLEGTLAYLSPEQTGRMNRGIDYRSDFYSLGVTFFELLSGQLPFESEEPIELVHCHIAKLPPFVCDINADLPLMLGKIIRKLMAKNAEDRYQSALGLKHDLVTCLEQWLETGKHTRFELGQRDISDRFLIGEKLYGREQEVKALLEAFGRVANGAVELMLVAGLSGIGKTAVVNEVHKPIVRWNGYFIKGKYDQFNRNIPLSAFVQAFRDLMAQLLSESDAQLEQWRNKIVSALGESGQVMIEVIPELERIIGKQPPTPELSGSAAQNRFNLLFVKFIQVFTTTEHPLVVFLDDLQWADSASLNLMMLLMGESLRGYLLIIGAYRDNEVFAAHPLMLNIEDIEKVATVNTLALTSLSQPDVNSLIADTLSCSTEIALPLTELVYQKAKGNPFFTTQFLKALYEDGLITFNWEAGFWQCDVAQVRSLALTDDVVEFMAQQLQKLPDNTQDVLKLAACIGNQFDLATLALVSEKSHTETASDLWKALQEGFVIPSNEVYKFYQDSSLVIGHLQMTNHQGQMTVYKFLHDRVQQAAYSLIPHQQKQVTHLIIGQLLLNHTPASEQDEKLFEIVNQLNIGNSLIVDPSQKIQLAQLNLQAAQKARDATAYAAAFEYATIGIAMLTQERWQRQYELILTLYETATEAAYLSGNFEQMAQFVAVILANARTLLDTVKVYEIQIQAAQAQHQFLQGVELALQILERLEIHFPKQPSESDIASAFQATKSILAGRQALDLMALPQMTELDKLAAMRILVGVSSSAFNAAPALLPFITLEQVNLSLQYGNTSYSTNAYAYYGLLLCGAVGDIECGYEFGKLALKLLEHFNAKKLKARTYVGVCCSVLHWKEPLRNTLAIFQEGYQIGLETGDLESATICAAVYVMHSLFVGKELGELSRESDAFRLQMIQLKQEGLLIQLTIFQQGILNLIGDSAEAWQLVGKAFNQEQMLPVFQHSGARTALCYFYVSKLFLGYLFGKFELAVEAAIATENYLGGAIGLFVVPIFHTYDSLAHLAIYSQVSETEKQHILGRVSKNQEKMETWASYIPANHLHKFYLVEAERYRVLGQKSEAIELYDRAIAQAKENDYIQEEALANELAAKFYLDWGKERIAGEYLIEAYYGYARWGAKAKVADLERRYPQLLAPILQQIPSSLCARETIFTLESVTSTCSATSSSSNVSVALDLATILKAYQTLSGEIELEKLLSVLLSIVIENAGADKCVFMLLQDHHLTIEGSITVGTQPVVLQHLPIKDSQEIPLKLIYKVKHNRQTAVLLDASADPTLANDPYIIRQQPYSILCSPILHQGKLRGILYLENNLATAAFTSDRVELLNLLCAQAAISLENARLYRNSQNYAQQLTQSLTKLQASETRFQNLANNIPGMVYQFRLAADGSTSTPYVSSGCLDLYGLEPESVMAGIHSLYALHHPEDDPAIAQAVAYSAQTLTPFEQEWRIILPSGTVKWIYSVARPERQADGAIVWDGVVIDISDRKRAEKQLQESQHLLELVLNTIPHQVFWKDCNLIYQGSNRAFAEVVGFSSSTEIVGKSDYELSWTTEESDWFRQCDRRVIESNLPELGIVETTLQADGTTVWIETSKLPLHDATGTVIGVLGIYQDISDRKQAEIALQEKEQFLSSIYDGAEIVIFVLDVLEDGSFRYAGWNPASERGSGISVADIVGKTPTDVFGAVKGKNIQQRFAECATTGKSFYSEDCLTFGGQESWWFATLNPIKNAEGRVYRIIGTTFDISDRKRAELAVQQKSEELEQALHNLQNAQLQIVQSEKMSALGNLVAGVAHEMNNPLGFILASLKQTKPNIAELTEHLKLYQETFPNPGEEIIDHAGEIDLDYTLEDLPKALDAMEIACDRLRSISTSLRTFSRADREYKVPFNIHEGIDSTILILKHRLKANHQRPAIEVITEYGHLPQIDCFPGQLNQVFMNIIANAIDALDESNIGRSFQEIKTNPNRIIIQTSVENEVVKIAITDNGQGMSESVKQKIFEHLFTTKAVGKGTGLGLAIAKSIVVEKHGGSIHVNSTLSQGTEFIITLPTKAEQNS